VLVDSNGIVTTTPNTETAAKKTDESLGTPPATVDEGASRPTKNKYLNGHDKDDVFFRIVRRRKPVLQRAGKQK
jgi:phosphatidylinositol-3,4,5-trisphosphate 3-phosphatase/dual-specificity protein phosphatase PTEN